MKKLILILSIIFPILGIGQERTINLAGTNAVVNLETTKLVAYNGNISDRLIPTTRDTIDYYVIVTNQNSGPLHFYVNFTFDTIAGADTTISIAVLNKKFNSESYSVLIAAANTSAISAETQVSKTSLGVTTSGTITQTVAAHNITLPAYAIKQDTATFKYYPADSLKVPALTYTEASHTITSASVANSSLYYRYLKFRLILNGNDSVGTGIKVKRVELVFYN